MSQTKYQSPLCPGETVTAAQLETDRAILAFDRSVEQLSRRKFFGGLSGAAALMVTAGFLDVPRSFAQAGAPPTIAQVLNFALNLEYLEANLYSIVTTGNPISSSLNGGTPTIQNSPGKLSLDATTMALFQALVADEMNHINDLRTALSGMGVSPISAPTINYGAKGAITTQAQLLATARQFTAVGNSAYAGAAQFLVSMPAVLQTAAQILGAEGQHMGAVNYQCITQNVAASFNSTPSSYVDALDVPPSPTQYFTVSLPPGTTLLPPGIPPFRTPQQVLGDVYGVSMASTTTPPAGVTSGGFFPSGVNGSVAST